MNKKKSHLVKWLYIIFAVVLGGINAALTGMFSYANLSPAFGAGVVSGYLAGLYGLLIFDLAYATWFYVYLRHATSTAQRSLALAMSIAALFGSVMATITQLAQNSFSLVDLSGYSSTIGFVALMTMIVITAAHIVAVALFTLFDPKEELRKKAAELLGETLDEALDELETRVKQDKHYLINSMAVEFRTQLLDGMGYTPNLDRNGRQLLPAATDEEAAVSEPAIHQIEQRGYKRPSRDELERRISSNHFTIIWVDWQGSRQKTEGVFHDPFGALDNYNAQFRGWFQEGGKVEQVLNGGNDVTDLFNIPSQNRAPLFMAPSVNGSHAEAGADFLAADGGQ